VLCLLQMQSEDDNDDDDDDEKDEIPIHLSSLFFTTTMKLEERPPFWLFSLRNDLSGGNKMQGMQGPSSSSSSSSFLSP
jgi:hypothetical protein